jgi:chromosome segregation ATPase
MKAEPLPDDVEALKAALIVARAEAAAARAQQSDDQALIAHLKLQIEKLNRDRYGQRSERTARLLDQLELTLEELETAATEDELAAEMAATKNHEGGVVHAQAAVTSAVPGASAPRAGDRAGTCGVRLLLRPAQPRAITWNGAPGLG